MTIEQLQNSGPAKELLHRILAVPGFTDILNVIQSKAFPSQAKMPILVPGVHLDTTIAHNHHYNAGWSDCIEFIKGLPTGSRLPPESQEEEEPFAHVPEVAAIDKELKAQPPTA